jgi:hypothetical protein
VQAVTVSEAADELYGLLPGEFTAARDEAARAARAAGRRDDAAAIRKLARPTTSAWLVNQLSRAATGQLARLIELGEALQEAQRTLAGDRLRQLSTERRQVVGDLLTVAGGLADRADQQASPAVLEEVRATLEAALADQDVRSAVEGGQLTKALAYAGLGEVDLAAALAPVTAVPASTPAIGGRRGTGQAKPARRQNTTAAEPETGRAQRAGEAAAEALSAAEGAVASATQAVEAAESELSATGEQRQFLSRRISHLERELAGVRDEDARLDRDARQAQRRLDQAERELRAARQRLSKLRPSRPGGPGD